MGAESQMLLALLGLAALYALIAIKLVGQNERLIIFQMGKPIRVGAPGLVITWPLLQSSKRMDMRTRSMSLPNIQLAGIACNSIVSGTFEFHVIDPIEAAAHADVKKATEEVVQSTLLSVVSIATIKECLTERFVLENQTLDLVNRRQKLGE